MILICKENEYNNELFPVSKGTEYLVLGLTFKADGIIHALVQGGKYWVSFVPIQLFDIKDSRVSKYWRFKYFESRNIALWHPVMYKPFFHDDLSEGLPEVVEEYMKMCIEMETEHQETIDYSVDVHEIIGSLQKQAG